LGAIGVAANNAFGIITVSVMDTTTVKVSMQHWNKPDSGGASRPA
jgi:hypothetical protein